MFLDDMQKPVIVVSGLPRSGTSMMMKMLAAGGIEILTDGLRSADIDNPEGYYEFEQAKQLDRDAGWMADARGRAVKVISMLLYHLPAEHPYRIVFMHRDLKEVLQSQQKMLARLGEPMGAASDEQMTAKYRAHLEKVIHWLSVQKNMHCMHVKYSEIIKRGAELSHQLKDFLQQPLDVSAMAQVVDPGLYRNRGDMTPPKQTKNH